MLKEMTKALVDMYPDMRRAHRVTYPIVRRFFNNLDKNFIVKLRGRSQLFIANSKYCAGMYEDMGIEVDGVIYPPLDCEQFNPKTHPSEDYVLTYFGKETKYPVIKSIADAGVKMRAFGAKGSFIPTFIRKHPNIEIEGKVSARKANGFLLKCTLHFVYI